MSLFSEEDSLSGKPLYYQGKFMSGHSMRSDDDITQRSLRPGTYGTLTAADVGSRAPFQLPAAAGAGGSSNDYPRPGVFNLPRYYPKYKSFAGGGGESIKSRGSWPRQSYKDNAGIDHEEPVYAKPNKLKTSGVQQQQQQGVLTLDNGQTPQSQYNETFTVVDGFDEESLTDKKRRQRKTRIIAICVVSVVIFLILAGVAIFLGVYLSKSAKLKSSVSSNSTTLGTASTATNGVIVTTTTSGVSYNRVDMTTVESSKSSSLNDIHGNTVKNTVLLDNSERTSSNNELTSTVPPDNKYNHSTFPSTLPPSATHINHSISTNSFITGSLVAILGSTSDEKVNNSTSSSVSVFESSTQSLTSDSFTSESTSSVKEASTDTKRLAASFSSNTESNEVLSSSTVSAENTSEETISSSLFTSSSFQSSGSSSSPVFSLNHTNSVSGLISSSV